MGISFQTFAKCMSLYAQGLILLKIKVASLGGSPSLFKVNKSLAIDNIALQRGYIWDTLHIDWEGIVLTHGCHIVNVCEHVSVPLIDRIRMRRVFL